MVYQMTRNIPDTDSFMLKLLISIILLTPAVSFSENISVSINDDGGKTSQRH